jgi:hypothetical protein
MLSLSKAEGLWSVSPFMCSVVLEQLAELGHDEVELSLFDD